MPCAHCQKARQATATAIRSAGSGNLRQAAILVKEAASALRAKAESEALRVRGLLTRR